MNVLLTGGAGYIGSHVALICQEVGHQVSILDNFSNSSPKSVARVQELSRKHILLHKGDVRDPDLLRHIFKTDEIDTVIHLAGLKSVGESASKPLDYYDINMCGSLTLARTMADCGIFRFVFSSTASIYGNQETMPVTERSPVGTPASPYGRTKLMVEYMLNDLCASDSRWSVAVLRYFNPVGAHSSGTIGESPMGTPTNLVPFAMQVAAGKRISLSVFGDDYPTKDGTGVRDYIHVMDLAFGHLAAVNFIAGTAGFNVWNLGTGHGHSVLEVINAVEKITGRELPYRIEPRRQGDIDQCWASAAKAEEDLGWRAHRTLDEMLADHWYWQTQNPDGYE